MARATTTVLVIVVLLAGICAALPFRKSAPEGPLQPAARPARIYVLRHVIPLEVMVPAESSPARALYDSGGAVRGSSRPAEADERGEGAAWEPARSIPSLETSYPQRTGSAGASPSRTRSIPSLETSYPQRTGSAGASPSQTRSIPSLETSYQKAAARLPDRPGDQPPGVPRHRLDRSPPSSDPGEDEVVQSRERIAGAEQPSVMLRHRLRDGDSLSELARRYLGDAQRQLDIYHLNRDLLPSPDLLPVGVEIRIPLAAGDPLGSPPAAAASAAPASAVQDPSLRETLVPVPPEPVRTPAPRQEP